MGETQNELHCREWINVWGKKIDKKHFVKTNNNKNITRWVSTEPLGGTVSGQEEQEMDCSSIEQRPSQCKPLAKKMFCFQEILLKIVLSLKISSVF